MPSISLVPACTDTAIRDMADMASAIWHEYWPIVLSEGQIDYMVDTMQSFEPIKYEIRQEGYLYWFVLDEAGKRVGYLSVRPETPEGELATDIQPGEGKLFVSKVYLLKEERGKHYASRMLDFCEAFCRANGLSSLYLHVNKHNEMGIRAYKGRGWYIAEDSVSDIGNGYVMDDYIMAKEVALS